MLLSLHIVAQSEYFALMQGLLMTLGFNLIIIVKIMGMKAHSLAHMQS